MEREEVRWRGVMSLASIIVATNAVLLKREHGRLAEIDRAMGTEMAPLIHRDPHERTCHLLTVAFLTGPTWSCARSTCSVRFSLGWMTRPSDCSPRGT